MGNTTFSTSERIRLTALKIGQVLLFVFLITTVLSVVAFIKALFEFGWKNVITNYVFLLIFIILLELLLFWVGIILVYLTSIQLGIRERVIGIIVGWMPILNIIALIHIIRVTAIEYRFERKKDQLNVSRINQKVCQTKYPLLLVHGVFFRDSKYLNYWGRIPRELEKNGAVIFYGNHQSAAAVSDSAVELTEKIKQIVKETGSKKVNVIAHSKGGLDIRYACSCLDAAPFIASLTTINSPHKGCEFADFLLSKAGEKFKNTVALAYNAGAKKFGDKDPDFISAVTDLTSRRMTELNQMMSDFDFKDHNIYTQSFGSNLKHMTSGRFPLNMSYHLVKYFDGPNDGLVGYKSFPFGEKYEYLEAKTNRGISHGDMIDLNREDIPGFDVREFYVKLVSDLKERNL